MSEEVFTKDRSGFVYLLKSQSGHYKIGYSKNPDARSSALDIGPHPLSLVHMIASDNARWLESFLHEKYEGKRVRGEWFALNDSDVAELLSTARYDPPSLAASDADVPIETGKPHSDYYQKNMCVKIPEEAVAMLNSLARKRRKTKTDVVLEIIRNAFLKHRGDIEAYEEWVVAGRPGL